MKQAVENSQEVKLIFVVDDAQWHNILLKKMLDDYGYEVQTFTNGHLLLENLKNKNPSLVISDINMPELDGYELHERIKESPYGKNIPVMYVSSMNKEKVEKKAEQTGAVGVMQKPLSKDPFLEIVAQKL